MRVAWTVVSVLLALSAVPPAAAAPHRRALLIGVSEYERGGNPNEEWWKLESKADVAALRDVLADKFGFAPADIATLTSRSETTRDAILGAFEKLIAATGEGDVVYIHYSGHGTPVPDKDGDEVDGLDESLVPSDYVSRKDGSRNILDDTIDQMLAKLRARGAASILLTFDSCFSGSQTRGGRMVVRGGNFLDVTSAVRDGKDPDVTGLLGKEAFAQGYVVISAARNDQTANETDDGSGGGMGLLTYALVRELREAGPDTTYRDLFDGVLDAMARRQPGQTPQLEGDADTKLLNGTALAPEPYLETRIDEHGRMRLQAGSLHGITVGSQFALYPRGTRTFDGAGVLAKARVIAVTPTTAVIQPEGGPGADALRGARAIEIAHQYGDPSIVVDLSAADALPRGGEIAAAVERHAAEKPLVRVTRGGAWDIKVCGRPCPELRTEQRARDEDAVTLVRRDGSRAAGLGAATDLPAALVRAIEAEARWEAVSALDRRDPRIALEVRVVPVDVTLDSARNVTGATRRASVPRTPGGQPELALGDYFMVEVRNTGALDAYVTVLDLSPDGSINPIWPHPKLGGQVQENKVRASQVPQKSPWVLVPYPYVFRIGPPTGNEILKAIATDVPTDFRPLLTLTLSRTAGERTRGEIAAATSPVGRLLSTAVTGGTRGGTFATQPPDPSAWAAASYTFLISGSAAGRQ